MAVLVDLYDYLYVFASFSLVLRNKLKTIKIISTVSGDTIEPDSADLNISIQNIKIIPEICPINNSKPFDVPSGVG